MKYFLPLLLFLPFATLGSLWQTGNYGTFAGKNSAEQDGNWRMKKEKGERGGGSRKEKRWKNERDVSGKREEERRDRGKSVAGN